MLSTYGLAYLGRNHLIHEIGESDGGLGSAYSTLVDWTRLYDSATFAVRQLAWPLLFWHAYIAYVFLVSSRGFRAISSIQKLFPWAIVVVLFLTGISAALEVAAYIGILHINHLLLEVILTGVCLLFVLCAYIGACMALMHRTIWKSRGVTSIHINNRNLAIAKLLSILAVFIGIWSWVQYNQLIYLINGDDYAVDVSIIDSELRHVSFLLQRELSLMSML